MDLLNEVVVPSLVKISCGFISELFKTFHKKIYKKTIENLVSKFVNKYTDSEIDSGSFDRFLNRTETKLSFKNYILYNAYRKSGIKFRYSLDKDTFILQMVDLAYNYVKNDVDRELSKDVLKEYFDNLISIIEQRLIDDIPEEYMAISYFMSQRISELEKLILSNSINIEEKSNLFEIVRLGYLKIIKSMFRTSHVYGFSELEMYSFYVFPCFSIQYKDKQVSHDLGKVEWKNIFNNSNLVSVIGGAGFGKSLFLRNLVNKHQELTIFENKEILPIYCDLKRYYNYSKNKADYSIEDFLVDSMIHMSGMDKDTMNKSFLRYYLNSGRCLILFDALDEVHYEDREHINKIISSFFDNTNKNNKVCITSREQGFISETPVIYKVLPIDISQIQEYLEKMSKLGYFKKEDTPTFLKQCRHLIEKNFLTSFLILSLLVKIFKAEKELPENKIDLYEKCIEYIAIDREKKDKKVRFDFKLMGSILSNSSFEKLSTLAQPNNKEVHIDNIKEILLKTYRSYYLDQNTTILAIDEFIRFCSERTELYVLASKEKYYKFFHRSFFEFYYAKFLINQRITDKDLFLSLSDFDLDSEIYELTSSLLKKYNYDRYVRFLEYILKISKAENKNKKLPQNSLLRVAGLLQITNEKYFLNEFYNIFFSFNKKIYLINDRYSLQLFTQVIFRTKDESEVCRDAINFYEKDIITSYFLNNMINSSIKSKISTKILTDININLNLVFIIIENKIKNKDYIEQFILKYSLEEIQNIIYKFITTDNIDSFKYLNAHISKQYKKLSQEVKVNIS